MSIFERVKQVAEDEGFTLRKVEDNAGLSPKSLYNWKKSSPKLDNVQKVADVLNVSLDYLLGNTDEKHPKQITGDPDVDGVDLNEYFEKRGLLRFNGKPIPEEDLRIIYRILETGEED